MPSRPAAELVITSREATAMELPDYLIAAEPYYRPIGDEVALLGELNGIVATVTNDILARALVFAVTIAIIITRPNGLFAFKRR